jgi:hypothetical protein
MTEQERARSYAVRLMLQGEKRSSVQVKSLLSGTWTHEELDCLGLDQNYEDDDDPW